ncbi:protein PLANT CADMIUM RESISTANCE 12-like [Corylus avellana]|uniref:protein PLANT CADMIUM RESISTANCE 12-like n=1 Tax=Corylus avellana TaxID=13451 RepID=UPI001E236630|nr:protein PLANT CADMIUM RESISTANCE 12-like [Corylus avellana]
MHPNNQNAPRDGQWSTGLCGCCDDPLNYVITCCFPFITAGQIVEIVDGGNTSCLVGGLTYFALAYVGCGWVYSCTYRSKLRALFSLPEAPCADWLVHCCCCPCALRQEYRELRIRGADPSLGWQGNVEKWRRTGTTPPIVAPGMTR